MSASARFLTYERGVGDLRETLLPGVFSPTGDYDDRHSVQVMALAFRLLAHAEIEHFVEDRATELFDAAWDAWTENGVASRALLALLAFSGKAMQTPTKKAGKLEDVMQKAQAAYRARHRRNNGVKEENIIKLILPLGIDSVDGTLLSDLSSLGARRGEAAHQRARAIQQQIDPSEEYKAIENISVGLRTLDRQFSEAISQIQLCVTVGNGDKSTYDSEGG